MKTKRIDNVLVWILFFVAVVVALVLVLTIATPVGASTNCGPLVGNAAALDDLLTLIGAPHEVTEGKSSIITCSGTKCPKPKVFCSGWRIRLISNITPNRFVDLYFNKAGDLSGGVR